MSDIIYFNKSGMRFPTISGKPVALDYATFKSCCCPDLCCDEEHAESAGQVDLIARYPYVYYQAQHAYPYPGGVICLGPFEVPVYVRFETNASCYYDDKFYGGVSVGCETPPPLWGGYYGPEDGTPLVVDLANPLEAGAVYKFTVISSKSIAVGVELLGGGTYSRIKWSPI
jgi:hypothetical protein